MCSVSIKPAAAPNETKIMVRTPYHPDFSSKVRPLNGKWQPSSKSWVFDARDTDRVKNVCRNLFGTDGDAATAEKLITIKATCENGCNFSQRGAYLLGRALGYATGRDSGARLSEGVVILSGNITSGGSVKNWLTVVRPGTVLEIRDLPEAAITLDHSGWEIEIVPDAPSVDLKEALRTEREKLIARIAEIDAELLGE